MGGNLKNIIRLLLGAATSLLTVSAGAHWNLAPDSAAGQTGFVIPIFAGDWLNQCADITPEEGYGVRYLSCASFLKGAQSTLETATDKRCSDAIYGVGYVALADRITDLAKASDSTTFTANLIRQAIAEKIGIKCLVPSARRGPAT